MVDSSHRLLSYHDTLLYFDEAAAQIRHGNPGEVPKNLVLEADQRRARLIVLGTRLSELCHVAGFEESRFVTIAGGRGPYVLNVDDLGPETIAVSYDGCYFSCEPDGSVVFNRTDVQGWETLRTHPVSRLLDLHSTGVIGEFDAGTHTLSVESGRDGRLTVTKRQVAGETPVSFAIAGPFNSSWSLAAVNRRLASEIDRANPAACRVLADDGPITDVAGDDLERLVALAGRPQHAGSLRVVIQQRWPVSPPGPRGDLRLAYFFWEESRVSPEIIEAFNKFEGVLIPAEFIRGALIESGLTKPIVNVGYSPDLSAFLPLRAQREPRASGHKFTFLHVSALLPRKGVDLLLAAYARTFTSADHVRLVIKGPYGRAQTLIEATRADYPDLAEIVVIDRDLSLAELADLYRTADAMVLPARGEGFNIPAAEALAAGLPLIVTGYGGHMQFCNGAIARLIDYNLVRAESHFGLPHSLWAEAKVDDLCAALREAVEHRLTIDEAERDAALLALGSTAWVQRLTQAIQSNQFGSS